MSEQKQTKRELLQELASMLDGLEAPVKAQKAPPSKLNKSDKSPLEKRLSDLKKSFHQQETIFEGIVEGLEKKLNKAKALSNEKEVVSGLMDIRTEVLMLQFTICEGFLVGGISLDENSEISEEVQQFKKTAIEEITQVNHC